MLHQKRYMKMNIFILEKRLESVPCYCHPSKKHIKNFQGNLHE